MKTWASVTTMQAWSTV